MKEIFFIVTGIALGVLGTYFFCCQEDEPPRVISANVIEDEFKKVGDLVFCEKAMLTNADIRIDKSFKILGKKVVSDGVIISSKWTGLHRYGVNFKEKAISVENTIGKIKIIVPPYSKRV